MKKTRGGVYFCAPAASYERLLLILLFTHYFTTLVHSSQTDGLIGVVVCFAIGIVIGAGAIQVHEGHQIYRHQGYDAGWDSPICVLGLWRQGRHVDDVVVGVPLVFVIVRRVRQWWRGWTPFWHGCVTTHWRTGGNN